MFLFLFLTLISVVYGYAGWRLISPLELGATRHLSASLAVLCFGLLPPITILFRRILQGKRWHDQFCWFTYASMGFFVLTFLLLLSRDLVWLAWNSAILLAKLASENPKATAENMFQASSSNPAVMVVAILMFAHGFYQARRRPRIAQIDVSLPHLPEALEGFRSPKSQTSMSVPL